jgi:UDP-N-acetylmuramate--alanine ligase
MTLDAQVVHFIGIGGTGLSAIARVLLESGLTVRGSDRQTSPLLQSLEAAGAQVFIGHRPENVQGADLVIRSSAVPDDNVEVQAAQAAGIPVLKRADYLGQLMAGRLGIGIAGTHGKTTTTAMIAWILTLLGKDPTYIIGGVSLNLGKNAHAGQGEPFVIEADEYDHMFLGLQPRIAVVTNIEHDHPDCYPTLADFQAAFLAFAQRVPADGVLIACGDDAGAAQLIQQAKAQGLRTVRYGLQNSQYACLAHHLAPNSYGGYTFDVICTVPPPGSRGPHISLATLALRVPGEHNVRNALAALAVANEVGLPVDQAALALNEFTGTGRRFELRGEAGGVVVVDDYAHHPTEIRATLAGARTRYLHRNIWTVWQPHTYSRTRTLFADFITAFENADHVLVTEIYPAREAPPADGFSARQVVAAMSHKDARYVANLDEATALLTAALQPGDVLLVLSAGDADQISARILAARTAGKPEPVV